MPANLPEVQFAERDAGTIEASIITGYEAISGRTLSPGDPVRLFLESIAAIIINQRSVIDFTGKQNLLAYARDEYLDALGQLVIVERLEPQPAVTTIEYTLSEAQPSAYSVPEGTEVTNGDLIFETIELLEIPAGETQGTVSAECSQAGTIGNGLLPGQIRSQVKPLPFVQSVTNTVTTQGGADREADDPMRERIRLAPSQFSVAGPEAAYVFWARSANQAIIDVSVESPTPVVVEVRVLLEGGEIPQQEIIDQVEETLTQLDVRPLTDDVQVMAPTAENYTIDFDYWINTRNNAQSVTIQQAVEDAVEDYRIWQRSAIGRDINPDELVERVKAAGAKRLVVRSPSFTVLDRTQVAQDTSVSALYQGLEDA